MEENREEPLEAHPAVETPAERQAETQAEFRSLATLVVTQVVLQDLIARLHLHHQDMTQVVIHSTTRI